MLQRVGSTAAALALALTAVGGVQAATASHAQKPPLADYFGNTLVCAAAQRGVDLCHTWFYPDGHFINFDAAGAHPGHYTVGPRRPDGKYQICQFWDNAAIIKPPELMPKFPGRPGAGVICETKNYRTTCTHYESVDGLSEDQQRRLKMTIAERFHQGMCYPIGPHKVGDVWFEDDDPLPGELGKDKVFLLKGHR